MVLLGLCDICGYYSQLEVGLQRIGVPCTLVNAFPSRTYERQTRPSLWPGRVVEAIAERRNNAARGTVRRMALTTWQAIWMAILLAWSIPFCETYVFAGGTSFIPPFDLWLLKRLGKRIVVVFHGSDARAPYVNGSVACGTAEEVAACAAEAARMKSRMRVIERHADVIVNHVLSSHLHERAIAGWLNIGIPADLSRCTPTPGTTGGECVIVHAPTRPGPKGTPLIEAAIERLRNKGHRIKFVKLVGKTNAEVLAAIRDCDFAVDELFSDITMASFATEAAGFGKAAVVGLHGLDLLQRWTQPHLLPPAVLCEAGEVETAIESLIVDPERRRQAGLAAREFVETHWSATRVAERFRRLCDGTVPESWYFDPAEVPYVYGWGLSDAQARARVGAVIAAGGVAALQLQDKPGVERAFVEFASRPPGC